jgi:hypothetical protein
MKRLLVLMLLLAFCALPEASFSQEQESGGFMEGDRRFYGGLTAGANFSEVIGDAYHGYHKLGLNAGALVYVKLAGPLSASLELIYSQKGTRGIRQVNSAYVGEFFEKYYIDLNYVEMPFQLHYLTNFRTHISAGVSYSRLLKSREDIVTDQPIYLNPDLYVFQKDDWAFIFGANYEFYDRWFIGLRYQKSFKPVRYWYNTPLGLGSGDQFNTYFTLRLTYLLR